MNNYPENRITKQTAISLAMAFTIISSVATGFWTMSKIDSKAEYCSQRINIVEENVKVLPTRYEFDEVNRKLDKIQSNIEELLKK